MPRENQGPTDEQRSRAEAAYAQQEIDLNRMGQASQYVRGTKGEEMKRAVIRRAQKRFEDYRAEHPNASKANLDSNLNRFINDGIKNVVPDYLRGEDGFVDPWLSTFSVSYLMQMTGFQKGEGFKEVEGKTVPDWNEDLTLPVGLPQSLRPDYETFLRGVYGTYKQHRLAEILEEVVAEDEARAQAAAQQRTARRARGRERAPAREEELEPLTEQELDEKNRKLADELFVRNRKYFRNNKKELSEYSKDVQRALLQADRVKIIKGEDGFAKKVRLNKNGAPLADFWYDSERNLHTEAYEVYTNLREGHLAQLGLVKDTDYVALEDGWFTKEGTWKNVVLKNPDKIKLMKKALKEKKRRIIGAAIGLGVGAATVIAPPLALHYVAGAWLPEIIVSMAKPFYLAVSALGLTGETVLGYGVARSTENRPRANAVRAPREPRVRRDEDDDRDASRTPPVPPAPRPPSAPGRGREEPPAREDQGQAFAPLYMALERLEGRRNGGEDTEAEVPPGETSGPDKAAEVVVRYQSRRKEPAQAPPADSEAELERAVAKPEEGPPSKDGDKSPKEKSA